MANYTEDQSALKTIDDQGNIPECRLGDAQSVQDLVQRLWRRDEERARMRSKVRGLVDGNPPYRAAKLREANRADAANVNWGTGRTYMESGAGAFYDLFSEAPGCIAIQTSFGAPDKRAEWSRIMSAEADRILLNDPDWDYHVQNSINEMVLFGVGPFMFEDCFKVLPISVSCGSLKVPEMTPATTSLWELSSVDVNMSPPRLYDFIKDESAATEAGWNVEYVKRVIQNACQFNDSNGYPQNWEWYQDQLKNKVTEFFDDSLVCKLAFVFGKEFDGTITQVIVEREQNTTANNQDNQTAEFLFKHIGWYENFTQCLHPFYFDRGNGGYHHSVTGLGVKMYGAMEYQNRLLCNLMDKGFAPKVFFMARTGESKEKMQIARYGDWGVVPAGTEILQNPIQGYLVDGLSLWRATDELTRSNLSSYRQQVPNKTGNPVTARQAMLEASQQASLSKTSYNRFYRQLDLLYAEIVRRLFLEGSSDKRATECRERCLAKGVPKEAFGQLESVRAARVVGQGSALLRQDAIMSLGPIVSGLPEEGRTRWTDDLIATTVGSAAVERYNPKPQTPTMATDQQAEAMDKIAGMKVGLPPVITSSQDPVTYATTFLRAASQALESLQQGGSPQEVLAFLQLCGPAIMAHLKRFEGSQMLKPIHDALLKQWEELAAVTDKVQAQVRKMVEARMQQQQKTQAAMSDQEIKTMRAMSDMKMKQAKSQQQMAVADAKTKQTLALNDAKAASEITRNQSRQSAELAMEGQRHVHDMQIAEREAELSEKQAGQTSEHNPPIS